MSDNLQFTEDQLKAASFQLALENNAMLRVLISNQIKIMEKLEIENDLAKNAFDDLVPGSRPDDVDTYPLVIKSCELMTGLIQTRVWEWTQMNTNITDSENED